MKIVVGVLYTQACTEHTEHTEHKTEQLFSGSLPSAAVTQAETRALVAQSGGVDELRQKVTASLAQSRSSVTVSQYHNDPLTTGLSPPSSCVPQVERLERENRELRKFFGDSGITADSGPAED